MKRLIKKSNFFNDYNFKNKNVLVYKNPSSREVDEIIKESGLNSIRVFVDKNGDTYCWDANIPHSDMANKLSGISSCIRLNITPNENIDIYITSEIKSGTDLYKYLSNTNLSNYGVKNNTPIYINTDTYNAEWQECYNGDDFGELISDLEDFVENNENENVIAEEYADNNNCIILNNYYSSVIVKDLVRIEISNNNDWFCVRTPEKEDNYYATQLKGGLAGNEAKKIINDTFLYHPLENLSNKYNINYEICEDDNEPYNFDFKINDIYFNNNNDNTWSINYNDINSFIDEENQFSEIDINKMSIKDIDLLLSKLNF